MASFNPAIQNVNQENFVRPESRSIETPASDKSKALLFSGVGDVVSEGFKAADQLQEHNVKQETANAQQKEADYELAYKAKEAGVATPGDLLAVSQGPPQQITNYQDQSDLLKQASENGKASSVYFEARQLALAKDLRRRYPGYVDTIDATTAKVTGRNPANALREDLTSMANENRSRADAERKKLETLLTQNLEVDGIDNMLIALRQGKEIDEPAAIKAISGAQKTKASVASLQADIALKTASLNLSEKERSIGVDNAKKSWGSIAEDQYVNSLSSVNALATDPKDKLGTAENIRKIQEHAQDPSKNTDEDARAAAAAVAVHRDTYIQKMLAFSAKKGPATKEHPEGTPSILETIGFDAVMEPLKQATKYSDEVLALATQGQYGAISAQHQAVEAMQNKTDYDLSKNVKIGEFSRITKFTRETMGETGAANFWTSAAQNRILSDPLSAFATFYRARTAGGIATQTPTEAQKTLIDFGANPEQHRALLDGVPKLMTAPDIEPQAKINTAKQWYIPSQAQVFAKYALDGRTIDGRLIPGQETLFQQFASPAVTSEIHKLSKSNPALWDNYVQWARNVFKEGLVANIKLHDLSNISVSPGVKILWSTDSNSIVLKRDEVPRSVSERNVFRGGQTSVDQSVVDSINKQIVPLVNIAKEQNRDVRVLVAEALLEQEQNPVFASVLNAIKTTVQAPSPKSVVRN